MFLPGDDRTGAKLPALVDNVGRKHKGIIVPELGPVVAARSQTRAYDHHESPNVHPPGATISKLTGDGTV